MINVSLIVFFGGGTLGSLLGDSWDDLWGAVPTEVPENFGGSLVGLQVAPRGLIRAPDSRQERPRGTQQG